MPAASCASPIYDTMGISPSKTISYFAGNESMFGDNTLVTGGYMVQAKKFKLIQRNDNRHSDGYQLLQARVATSAWHNSAQRVDPPACHPRTREAILKQIFDWITASEEDRDTWLMWLNGAAGAGKSAIAQSIARLCVREGIAVASFFFSRMDPTRNTATLLVSTLVYQLIQAIPETKDDIIQTIEDNPLIFDESLQSQFQALIVDPLIRAQAYPRRSNSPLFLLVLLDGIDECINRDFQCNIINTIGNVIGGRSVPVVFLACSRREPRLIATFKRKNVACTLTTLALDDVAQATDDIRRFLCDEFADLKNMHPYGNNFPADWPSPSAIEKIVAKSSGQFIYASVSMKYICSPNANPPSRLDTIVNGISSENPSVDNPFARLDALYRYIFSEVENLEMVLNILAYVLLSGDSCLYKIRWVFQLAPGDVEAYLADLSSVITILDDRSKTPRGTVLEGPKIKILNASLPDFLHDQRRSGSYYINPEYYSAKLACTYLALSLEAQYKDRPSIPIDSYSTHLVDFLKMSKPTEQLRRLLLQFGPMVVRMFVFTSRSPVHRSTNYVDSTLVDFLYAVKCLNFNDEKRVYNQLLDEVSGITDRHVSFPMDGPSVV